MSLHQPIPRQSTAEREFDPIPSSQTALTATTERVLGKLQSACQADSTGSERMQVQINGKSIDLKVKSDESVVLRVAAHIERRIKEDDWLPYKNKQDALSSWSKLGGIRVKVLEAYDLI
jgi:hypothetical protein